MQKFKYLKEEDLEMLGRAIDLALADGAKKYEANSWKRKTISYNKNFISLNRHLTKLALGQNVDEDSGLHHLCHIACRVLFMVYDLKNGNLT